MTMRQQNVIHKEKLMAHSACGRIRVLPYQCFSHALNRNRRTSATPRRAVETMYVFFCLRFLFARGRRNDAL